MNYKNIADKYGISLVEIDHDGYGKNGGSSGDNQISIKPCDEEYMYELSFWHELGHILFSRSMGERTHFMSTMSHEGAAWEIGLTEAARHGRVWDYKSKEMEWCRKQLASYVGGEYDDLKRYFRDKTTKTEGN